MAYPYRTGSAGESGWSERADCGGHHRHRQDHEKAPCHTRVSSIDSAHL